MKILLFLFIPLISFSQNISAADIAFEKKCAEINSAKYPVMIQEGIRLNNISCGKDKSLMYEFSFLNQDTANELQQGDSEILKKGFQISISEPIFKSGWFDEFKIKKSQIGFFGFDKNEKFLFVIIYDVGSNGEYQRNLYVEKQVENMSISAENILEGIKNN